MKFLFIILAIFIVNTTALAAAHDQNEAIRMLFSGQVRTDALIVKLKQPLELSESMTAMSVNSQKMVIKPLFSSLIDTFQPMSSSSSPIQNELKQFSVIHFPYALSLNVAYKKLQEIYQNPDVEYAFFEPAVQDAGFQGSRPESAVDPQSSNYKELQFHLKPSPIGVDAFYGWTIPGGTGRDIRVMDLETGWYKEHQEFKSVFWDNQQNQPRDHGTAVWGIIAAKHDEMGVSGISYDVDFAIAGTGYRGESEYETLVSERLSEAIAQLIAGDILVIEQHFSGPNSSYIPIEYMEPIFKVLQYATGKGIHCIAAGGNGYANLDADVYNGAFDVQVRDSGCILVGAAQPPTQAHLEKCDFSDYGLRIDAFGYGDDVVTTGYGDLYSESNTNSYTQSFSGTSSATPIVVGSVASILGMAKAKGKTISPYEMREALHKTGTAQKGDTSKNIGRLPNIKELANYFDLAK